MSDKADRLLENLKFAEQYVRFLSGRARTVEGRLRAKHLITAIEMLDVMRPNWRSDAVATLLEQSAESPKTEQFFNPPEPDPDTLFSLIMSSITKHQEGKK